MFWIGMIVGIILTFAVSFAWIVYCFKVANVSLDEFERLRDTNVAIIANRECTVEVWHDENCVHTDTFEEH